jgi:thimet oligopeptidase
MPVENIAVTAPPENLHAWEAGGADSAEALSAWVSARLAAHEAALAAMLAVEGERTPDNSLRLYDAAIEQLSLAGAQAGILNSVATDKAVRDQAQTEARRVAQAASALSLNRAVFEALAVINLGRGWRALAGAGAAIKALHVERTLLSYRLAGVDKDQATRDHLQSLHERATHLSLEFNRNIQEGAKTIETTEAELDGTAGRLPRAASWPERLNKRCMPGYPLDRPARDAAGDDLCRRTPRCASGCFWLITLAPTRPTSKFFWTFWPRARRLRTC